MIKMKHRTVICIIHGLPSIIFLRLILGILNVKSWKNKRNGKDINFMMLPPKLNGLWGKIPEC